MQKLEVYQSLWAMEQRHPDLPERSPEQTFAMIAGAGYDGVCLDPGLTDLHRYEPTRHLFDEHNLGCMFNAFPHTADELQPLLDAAASYNARQVNVIGEVMPIDYRDAVPIIRRWLAEASAMRIPLMLETHRNSMLNDLHFTLQIIEAVPELRLCADLSHFVVDREFELPLCDRDADYIQRVLARSDCFQGRVATREQIQIQIDFPQHREWVNLFKAWWKAGIRLWRERSADNATLIFLCELGPPSYAITDAQGYELSDRWSEALKIKAWVQQIWRELDKELPT